MIPINLLILEGVSRLPDADMSIVPDGFGGIKELGMKLYTEWLLPFELISILLLVALVGAVVLAKRRPKKEVKNG
ncbi:MAG: NADH-quinone oxidoreductase subunit J, partial [Campylobacteraceae bacterium]|nr:NADH-quinone oxidoreductase subunit J [Campylobacteraceae bacterium]